MSVVVSAACSSSDNANISRTSDVVVTSEPIPTDDTAMVAVDNASDCETALAAFSAVSNILMSGLAKPSSFEADRYQANLGLTGDVIAPEIEDDYAIFVTGYSTAGEALATARQMGAGTVKGAEAIDQATAILNDVAVTRAAQKVATFLAGDCAVNKQ
jgi:hypothetical protein